MVNHKRKKAREKKGGWGSDSRLHKHERIDEAVERNLHKRHKKKPIVVMAKVKPNKPAWWRETGEFVWGRYETEADAERAIASLQKKRHTCDTYDIWVIKPDKSCPERE